MFPGTPVSRNWSQNLWGFAIFHTASYTEDVWKIAKPPKYGFRFSKQAYPERSNFLRFWIFFLGLLWKFFFDFLLDNFSWLPHMHSAPQKVVWQKPMSNFSWWHRTWRWHQLWKACGILLPSMYGSTLKNLTLTFGPKFIPDFPICLVTPKNAGPVNWGHPSIETLRKCPKWDESLNLTRGGTSLENLDIEPLNIRGDWYKVERQPTLKPPVVKIWFFTEKNTDVSN